MKYNFDEVIDRSNTNCMKVSGFRQYLFPERKDSIKFNYADDELVKMWIADMEFATPQVIVDKMRKRLDHSLFGYSMIFDKGYYEAYKKWCETKYDWSCNPEHLFTSPGIIPALYELVALITKEDEKVITFTPSYGYFKHAADHNNRELVCSTLLETSPGVFEIDFGDFEKKVKDPKVTLLILSNPHNPNGIIWTKDDLEKIAKLCEDNGVWLISDEIHCDLLRCGNKHLPMAKVAPNYDKVITCMSPSKTFNMAGLMLSNIIIQNEELIAAWHKMHYPFENPLSIVAIQAAYEDGADWLDELKKYLDENFKYLKEFLAERLPEAVFNIPAATYLAWVDFSAYFDAELDLTEWFANEAGVLLESGNQFVRDGEGFVRLNLACPKSMLIDCMEKIEKAIKEHN